MKALAKSVKDTLRRFGRMDKPLSEPDPAYGKPRPMTGLRLSAEQRARALAYNGTINHGDPAFAKRYR